MISVGGGWVLLCVAACAVIMSENRWIRILSGLYLASFAIAVLVEIVRGDQGPELLIIPVLLLILGLYAHSVHHMFDSRERERR